MKVVSPINSSHSFVFIPRIYTLEGTVLELINEGNKVVTEITDHIISGDDGVLSLLFDFTFIEGSKYSFRLYTILDDIYRGRIIATSQNVQEYNPSLNYITYE